MEEIMDFLVDNYVYVAAISGFLIIVLLGVVISGSRKRKKEKEPDMVSISDVNTGTVNDVAMNLNMQNSMHMQRGVEPLKVNEVPSSVGSTMQNQNPMPNNMEGMEPISEVRPVSSLEPNPNNNIVNPINNVQSFVNPTMSNNVEPTMGPVPNFNQNTVNPTPVSNVTPNVTPVMGNVQPNFVNEPVNRPIETNNSVNNVNETENIDIIDFSVPEGTTTSNSSGVELNPLNGNEPNFNQNNNQGIL